MAERYGQEVQFPLNDIPCDIIPLICNHLDYYTQESCRKVSWNLRGWTAVTKPRIDSIEFHTHSVMMLADIIQSGQDPTQAHPQEGKLQLFYNYGGAIGCVVGRMIGERAQGHTIQGGEHREMFFADMEPLLTRVASLNELSFCDESDEALENFESFGGILAGRRDKIQVSELALSGAIATEAVMEILPHVDPSRLENLSIKTDPNSQALVLNQVMGTDQWMQLSSVHLQNCRIPATWDGFGHLQTIGLDRLQMSAVQFTGLKNLCLNHENVENVTCTRIILNIPIANHQLFNEENGHSILMEDGSRLFCFKLDQPGPPDFIVGISFAANDVITVRKFRREQVPENAFVVARVD